MTEKSITDIVWQQDNKKHMFILIGGKIAGLINPPSEKHDHYRLSSIYGEIFCIVRPKFRQNKTLKGMMQAVTDAYMGTDEKPDDVIVTGKLKAWGNTKNDWLLTNEEYNNAKADFKPEGKCVSRFGGALSHGANIAGKTEAAMYLTSKEMTSNGYVMRLAFFEDEITKIAINDAPSGLLITSAHNLAPRR